MRLHLRYPRLVAALGALAVGLSTAAAMRPKPDTPPGLMIPDPELGAIPNPSHPLHNPYGFRGAAFEVEKPAGVFRIVVVGDSTAYRTSGDGWPEILHRRYADTGRCEVLNAAVAGHSLTEMYARYQRDVLPLAPNMVIVMAGIMHLQVTRPTIAPGIAAVIFDQMQREAEVGGFELVYVTPPFSDGDGLVFHRPRWGLEDREAYQRHLTAIEQAIMQTGVITLDAAHLVSWHEGDFYNAQHLDGEGHLRLADWLDAQLINDRCGMATETP